MIGLDWVGMTLSLTGAILVGQRVRVGWFVSYAAGLAWTIYGIQVRSWPIILLDVFFMANCIIALRRWGRPIEREWREYPADF